VRSSPQCAFHPHVRPFYEIRWVLQSTASTDVEKVPFSRRSNSAKRPGRWYFRKKWAALSVVFTRLSARETLFLNVPLHTYVLLRKWLIKVMPPECGELKMTALTPPVIEIDHRTKGDREGIERTSLIFDTCTCKFSSPQLRD
jgi:hypothetical protein